MKMCAKTIFTFSFSVTFPD